MKGIFKAASTVVPELFELQLHWVPITAGEAVQISDDLRLTPFDVDHLPEDGGAMGCVLDVGGKRIAYSGDTRPCSSLVDAVRHVDLLFHEAGGLEPRSSFVHMIGHSTGADAGRAACRASVERMVLTHFPWDSLIDPMLAEASQHFKGPIDLAQDLGHVDI